MANSSGGSVVKSGLTFMYDMSSDKSFKGKPTTNYAHNANPERSGSNPLQGDTYSATGDGTWNVRHQDAIRVFSHAGTELTSHINTGVTDWTNTYHGIWTFDEELGYPVSTMRDIGNGSWMYAGFGFDATINTPTKLGLTTGSNYVISWDQWTTNTSKSANCGLYGQNATNTGNGFHDGLSNQAGASAFNTKTHTWQRLYAIFTVSSNRGLNATWSQYNYGHYTTRGITKVANFQLEVGNTPSKFLYSTSTGVTDSRSSTEAIVDVAGGKTITINSLTYPDLNTFEFTSANEDFMTFPYTQSDPSNFTLEAWIYHTAHSTDTNIGHTITQAYSNIDGWIFGLKGTDSKLNLRQHNVSQQTSSDITYSTGLSLNTWYHVVAACNITTDALYVNGEQVVSQSHYTGTTGVGTCSIGAWGAGAPTAGTNFAGKIPVVRIYHRGLTASEVKQNYNASKSKYGF